MKILVLNSGSSSLKYQVIDMETEEMLAKGYFDGIPGSLDEAARVDGAGPLRTFFQIIIPVAKPILVFIALVNFTAPWFDFIFPKLILRSAEKKTLAVGLFEWISGMNNSNFTLFAAGAILVAIPITLLFVFLQKNIVLVPTRTTKVFKWFKIFEFYSILNVTNSVSAL